MKRVMIVLVALLGCGSGDPEPTQTPMEETTETPSAMAGQTVRSTTGEIRQIEDGRVTIQHEEVPDYMPAMTMPFFTDDASLVEGIAAGDRVTFSFIVEDGGRHVLTVIRKE